MFIATAVAIACLFCSCANPDNSAQPTWKPGDRFERIGRFELHGTIHEVFPLLCPVQEYKWLPGWASTMHYAKSGVAEEDAVFETKELLGMKVTWTTITYQPERFIEYLLVSGADVVRLSLSLDQITEGKIVVTWRMLFTTNSKLGKIAIKRAFSEENFQRLIDDRQRQLNYYLAHGHMIPASEDKPAAK
jgi:hypothetical protein